MALTANSTIAQWLDDPEGKKALEDAFGSTDSLTQAASLPLKQLIPLSQGQLTQETVDQLVLQANGGVAPEESEDASWTERITEGRFAGKTVIITGAAGGIGLATASRVAREGGKVIATDISAEGLEKLRSALSDADITIVAGDITTQETIDEIIDATGGRVDALANIAGINDDFSPLHETSDQMWDKVMAVNVTGPFKLSRAVVPLMLEAGRGAVVNIASEAGIKGSASGNAYTTSKHAVIGMSRSAAFMYATRGVRTNVVAPGGVATGIPFPPNVSEEGRERLTPFQQMIPTIATADQLAASITFLLSDDSVNINGAVLPSDGGWSVQ